MNIALSGAKKRFSHRPLVFEAAELGYDIPQPLFLLTMGWRVAWDVRYSRSLLVVRHDSFVLERDVVPGLPSRGAGCATGSVSLDDRDRIRAKI